MRRLIVHPENPQARLIHQAAQALRDGDLVIMPTDACAVISVSMAHKTAVDRLRTVRQLSEKHLLTLLCPDLSALATYAKVDDVAFRFLKAWTPGPYTFILNASKQVPRRLWPLAKNHWLEGAQASGRDGLAAGFWRAFALEQPDLAG